MAANDSCSFELPHYVELLENAKSAGYRFARFGEGPEPGDIFLRHDIDLTLAAAVKMAELEAELGVTATYLLMTESIFYNLASPEGVAAVDRIRELGHPVGLHAVYPNAQLDDRFEPIVAWHNPQPEYMTLPIDGAINVMGERYFAPDTYRSDSNQQWRAGCPHEELRKGTFPWLHMLIHPAIWMYEGRTMGETMRSMLNAERERRLGQLPGDRIKMGER